GPGRTRHRAARRRIRHLGRSGCSARSSPIASHSTMAVPYPIRGASDPRTTATRTRRYRSPRRDQQARHTRARVIAAAAWRFVEHGYAATTMRAVATDAGVALPTVELAFKTKARLLKAAIDTAIAGDDEPVPMLAREWAAQAESTAEPAGFVTVFAQVLVDSAQRAAGLTLAALEAARIDEDIAAIAAQLIAQRQ